MLSQAEKTRAGAFAALVLALLLGAAGCDSSTGPMTLPGSALQFVPLSSVAPLLETTDTTFWAVRGEDRRLEIRFQGQGGPGTGKRFLELRVNADALLRRPDGTLFAEGDSIEIRVAVDTVLILARLEPTGLIFSPEDPAELEIRYEEAEDNFLAREREFDLWRQERPGDPWELIGSVQLEEFDEIEAFLRSFTRYALAIGR